MQLILGHLSPSVNDDMIVNIDELLESPTVGDASDLARAILTKMCLQASLWGCDLDDFEVKQIDGDEEAGLTMSHERSWDFEWLLEVAQLFWYLSVEKPMHVDEAQVFAYINTNDWRFVSFDDLSSEIEDDCRGELPDDVGAWAKEWLEDTGHEMPDHLMPYVDFDAYGESLLSDFTVVEWEGRKYIYYA